MFGGARWILVEPAGDESVAGARGPARGAGGGQSGRAGRRRAQARLEAAQARARRARRRSPSPATSPTRARPSGWRSSWRRGHGLIVRGDVARRIAESCGGNRALIEQELAKFALYADASPGGPKPIDHDVVDALGAAADEGDLSRLVDSAASGDAAALEAELVRLRGEGQEGITLIRAMLRRMALLARLRAEVEQGSSPSAVMASAGKSLFFKEKDSIEAAIAALARRSHRQGDDPARRGRAAGQDLGRGRPGRRRRRIVRDLPPGGAAALASEAVAAEALADHVELVEARIGEADGAALGAVPDRDLEAEQVAQLPLERGDVGGAALIFDRRQPLLARLAGPGEPSRPRAPRGRGGRSPRPALPGPWR